MRACEGVLAMEEWGLRKKKCEGCVWMVNKGKQETIGNERKRVKDCFPTGTKKDRQQQGRKKSRRGVAWSEVGPGWG